MKTLEQLCVPRKSVFDASRRDTVLELSDLVHDRIDSDVFFEENYFTDGINRLVSGAFERFAGKSDQGVYLLTQAMGGGKTHSMIALGLLAKRPDLRKKIMGDQGRGVPGKIRVVGFSGRETDAKYGMWGAIAEQLGKKELFNDFYSPLTAPGPTSWINLLKGEPLLILIDELPFYFEHAEARTIGDSNLSTVTATALSNLLIAVDKPELQNACVIVSDLKATWEGGSQRLIKALTNFENEVNRSAIRLEPVGMNTDEVYHILRTRLFETLPAPEEIKPVAEAYAQAVKDARQMDLTNASPEQYVRRIVESYPFHFSIRDLYARFRENPGFQQTRGLIRLMRVVVSRLYATKAAQKRLLIHPYDLDLNHSATLTEITGINTSLENAIAHDIASGGESVAETIDSQLETTDAQDTAKLLFVSSLANIPNAVLGLSVPDIVSCLCAPGRDLSSLKKIVFSRLFTTAWYIHETKDGKLFFKNVKNLVADLKTRAESYNRESCLKELRNYLEALFQPEARDCYQHVQVFPPIDEIDVRPDRVLLAVCLPHESGGLSPELEAFHSDQEYKNRILFLTGRKSMIENLVSRAAEFKGITSITKEMDADQVPPNDPQRIRAEGLVDEYRFQLLSACRETFTTLVFPHMEKLYTMDFLMNFTDNRYNGEKQIRETLKQKQKFTEDVEGDSFRKKCEQRLFTQKVMPWSEIKKRAAMNTKWPWHHPDALDRLKDKLVHEDQWREDGAYVEKPPFPKPQTDVLVQLLSRDESDGTSMLRLTPVHGDKLFFEYGEGVTPGSMKIEDPKAFKVKELKVSFLCVDSNGLHENGSPVVWKNAITLKSRIFNQNNRKMVELVSAPEAPVRYTTDGSSPKTHGGVYDGPFELPEGASVVLAVAEKDGIVSEIHQLDIPEDSDDGATIDPERPLVWRKEHYPVTTRESYAIMGLMKKHKAEAFGVRAAVSGKHYVEMAFDPEFGVMGDKLESAVEHMRGLLSEGQVNIRMAKLKFEQGLHFMDWIAEIKGTVDPAEIQQ